MPSHDFKDIGDVLNFDILRGTITAIDSVTDTCTVSVDGASREALLFYHCEPDSILRDNGAIEGAASGFAVDDEVIVIVRKDQEVIKVIAHIDGVRHCAMYAVFTIASETTKQVVVWDVKKNTPISIPRDEPLEPLEMPCDFDDPDFQNWYLARKEEDTEYLFDAMNWWYSSDLSYILWPRTSDTFPYYKTYANISDFGTYSDYMSWPETAEPGHYSGLVEWLFNVYGDAYEDTYYTNKIFLTPLSFSAKAGSEVFGARWSEEYANLPLTNRIYTGHDHFGKTFAINSTQLITEGTPRHYHMENYLSVDYNNNYYRYSPVLHGVKSDRCVANVMLNYYTPCTIDADYASLTWYNVNVTPGDTVINVCSQALYYPNGYEGEELLPEGDNVALSALISQGVQAISDLVGKEQYIGITVNIMK